MDALADAATLGRPGQDVTVRRDLEVRQGRGVITHAPHLTDLRWFGAVITRFRGRRVLRPQRRLEDPAAIGYIRVRSYGTWLPLRSYWARLGIIVDGCPNAGAAAKGIRPRPSRSQSCLSNHAFQECSRDIYLLQVPPCHKTIKIAPESRDHRLELDEDASLNVPNLRRFREIG